MEWEQYDPLAPTTSNKPANEPEIRQLMNYVTYLKERNDIEQMKIVSGFAQRSERVAAIPVQTKKKPATVRGPYRKYTKQQIQELFDLVSIGWSARQASLRTGIVVRTGQHYIRTYNLDEEKRVPGGGQNSHLGGNDKKLDIHHTKFLIDFFDNDSSAALWETRDALYAQFPGISISVSAIHKHLVRHCSLTLKKLEKLPEARNADRTINLRHEIVSEWIQDPNMGFEKNCVFIDEAGFNMHLRRNFGRSKKGTPAKAVVPTNRGISITIIGTMCVWNFRFDT
jgi:transposase